MCQKASGAPFASFAEIEHGDFAWTRGKPAAFRSSSLAERDFCADCGTPLELSPHRRPEDRDHDRRLRPARTGWCRPGNMAPNPGSAGWSAIANLPSQTTLQNYGPEKVNGIVSHQHPDHD